MAKLKKLNNTQTAYFCEQLWLMLNAGMQLNDGLDIIAEDNDDAAVRGVCVFLSDMICNGNTLHYAMRKSGVFPQYAVSMTEIGGVSGRLDDVLKGLSEYYERRAEMGRTVRYSVVHPAMLLAMMSVVMAVLVLKVIPMFEGIFAQFDVQMGETVSNAVKTAQTVGTVVLVVLMSLIALAAVIFVIPPIRRAFIKLLYVFPPTSAIALNFENAKLTDALSMMISSGIDPESAMEYALTLIKQKKLRDRLSDCLKRVRGHEYFADAVCESNLLPKNYARSLKIAYTSGSFETVWKNISSRCSEEAERTATNLLAIVEPVIITVLALMIGSVLMTIMLPLMNIMSALG